MSNRRLNFLCVSTFFKGEDFLKACKAQGNNVYLLTKKELEHEDWPYDCIEETFYIDDWNDDDVINGIAYKFRSINFDRFVALDDFDVEKATMLREHFRMPGMGQTTGRYFRDKLAMRIQAQDSKINVPAFTALFNDDAINLFADTVPTPWLIKPRSEASATGIKKIHSKDELWEVVHSLGDDRHKYLVERFAPGDVYHVDSLNYEKKVLFTRVSQYLDTPFEVAHGGGIFRSHTVAFNLKDDKELKKMNRRVMKAFGMKDGASHTEFIKSHETGEYFFLETSSRVGGANLAEMVEASSQINLWGEWAKIEDAVLKSYAYELPEVNDKYAGIVVSLSRFEHPDTSSFTDAEIVWRMNKPWHIGLIVVADTRERVLELLDAYTHRISNEFHASAPAPDASV
ncbi:MAG: ATPase [Roseivirga sp.]|nr:ATPase [Roseivirga sp.]